MRYTVANINTTNLKNNFTQIKKLAPYSAIMAIVKANAYGHGMIGVSKVLAESGVDYLGVALIDEAITLRENGIKTPICVLVPENKDDATLYCENDIDVAVSSPDFVKQLSKSAKKCNTTAKIHIYIDTGMSRDGVYPNEALYFVKHCSKLSNIELVGICTHFSTSDSDTGFARIQLEKFENVLMQLREHGFIFKYTHAANSAAIVTLQDSHFNMVRPGISLYGYSPAKRLSDRFDIKPVMELKTKVIFMRSIQKDDSVGYNREFIARKGTRIATIPIGYGDGFSKILTNKAQCIIKGKRYPIVGTVCMDECMVDIGDSNINIGDEVILIGKQGDEQIGADDIASKIGTITYEVTTSLSIRVPRVFF